MAPKAARRRLRAWGRRHSYSFFSSLGSLLQHRLGTLMTVSVLGIAILLPLGLFITLKNLDRIDLRQEEWRAITAFVSGEQVSAKVEALAERLRQRPDVDGVRVVSPAAGMDEFREVSGFGPSLDALDENPLPWVLTVIPARSVTDAGPNGLERRAEILMDELRAQDMVESIQFDYKWLQRLARLLELGRAVVLVLSVLFGVAVIVLVANTIRLDVAARAEEIEVLALVGAGNGFIRQPFLYSGFWYGLMGGALALVLTWLGLFYLSIPLTRLLDAYGHGLELYRLDAGQIVALLLGSGSLGWLGALIAVRRYLRILAVGGTLGRR